MGQHHGLGKEGHTYREKMEEKHHHPDGEKIHQQGEEEVRQQEVEEVHQLEGGQGHQVEQTVVEYRSGG